MEPDSSQDPRIGKVLQERYRIVGIVDEGATGSVYKGERLKLGRQVAIKFLHPRYAADKTFMKRFEREALAMSRLAHPHCVSVLDFGVDDGPYIVMDYVTGQTLRQLLERGRLPVHRALQITRQVLAGLAHAHGQGIVHRDMKPANVMLTEATGTGDHVRILDFGLATLRDSGLSGEVSESWLVVGTPSYMSPEQSLGADVDARADVYGLGAMLFHLLTGEKPYDADDAWETLRRHREQPIPRLADVCPEVKFPDGLQELIDKSMAKSPGDRYQSAQEFAEALDAVAASGAVPEPLAYAKTARQQATLPPVPDDAPPVERKRSGSLFGVLVFLLFAGGAAVAGVWYLQNRDADRGGAKPVVGTSPDADPASVVMIGSADAAAVPVAELADAAPPDAARAVDASAVDAFILDLPPDELDEPIAAVEEDVEDDSPSEEPPEPTEPQPFVVNSVDDAKKLIAQGRREAAIVGLRKLKRKHPKSAYIPYLLGQLYFEKRWWSIGMEHYKVAIKNNRSYRRRSNLNKNVIRALGSEKTKTKAIRLYLNDIGRAGLKYLRRAAKRDKNRKVRSRARWLIKRLKR